MADSAIVLTVAVSLIVLAGDSSARELRPSDHGLVFQISSTPAANYSQEMRSFFNSEKSSPSTSSNVALPRAMNSSDASPPSWWRSTAVHGGGDRFGKALMAASIVCGIVGAVLFVASGLIYMLKYRKHKLNAAFRGDNGDPGENNIDDNNKLQLVVRDP